MHVIGQNLISSFDQLRLCMKDNVLTAVQRLTIPGSVSQFPQQSHHLPPLWLQSWSPQSSDHFLKLQEKEQFISRVIKAGPNY